MINDYVIEYFSQKLLFLFSFFQNEYAMTMVGSALKNEEFDFLYTVLITVLAVYLSDVILFFIGKRYQKKFDEIFKNYLDISFEIRYWLKNNGIFLILFERILYATHIPTLFILGASGYSVLKFLIRNIFGAIFWVFVFGCMGYFLPQNIIDTILIFQRNVSIAFILIFIVVIILRKLKY